MLLCTAVREQHLTNLTIISLQWLDSYGLEVVSDREISVSENELIEGRSASGVALTSMLVFNSLVTSLAGEYTCRASMTIPCTEVRNHTVASLFTVTVKCESLIFCSI